MSDSSAALSLIPDQLRALLRALAPFALYPDSVPMTRTEFVIEP